MRAVKSRFNPPFRLTLSSQDHCCTKYSVCVISILSDLFWTWLDYGSDKCRFFLCYPYLYRRMYKHLWRFGTKLWVRLWMKFCHIWARRKITGKRNIIGTYLNDYCLLTVEIFINHSGCKKNYYLTTSLFSFCCTSLFLEIFFGHFQITYDCVSCHSIKERTGLLAVDVV